MKQKVCLTNLKWPAEEEVAEAIRRITRAQEKTSQNLAKPNNDCESDLIRRADAICAIENTDCELTAKDWVELTGAIMALPSAETHEIRTETHGVCSDIISRADAMGAVQDHFNADGFKGYDDGQEMMDRIKALPPADTDMSEYCDRLWKIAYERGKAEGQKQVASKLKNPCDSLLTDDADDCKEHKSKLDLIRRQAAVGIIDLMLDEDTAELIRGYIDDLPSVTPTERTGEWENVFYGQTDDSLAFRCNKCGKMSAGRHNYCPNCGAKMMGGNDNE